MFHANYNQICMPQLSIKMAYISVFSNITEIFKGRGHNPNLSIVNEN